MLSSCREESAYVRKRPKLLNANTEQAHLGLVTTIPSFFRDLITDISGSHGNRTSCSTLFMKLKTLIHPKEGSKKSSTLKHDNSSVSDEQLRRLFNGAEQLKVLIGFLRDLDRAHATGENLDEHVERARALLREVSPDNPSTPAGEDGFMCGMDFDCELGERRGGVPVYSSLEDLAANRSCIKRCGVARVRVVLLEWLQRPDLSEFFIEAARKRVALGKNKGPRQ